MDAIQNIVAQLEQLAKEVDVDANEDVEKSLAVPNQPTNQDVEK